MSCDIHCQLLLTFAFGVANLWRHLVQNVCVCVCGYPVGCTGTFEIPSSVEKAAQVYACMLPRELRKTKVWMWMQWRKKSPIEQQASWIPAVKGWGWMDPGIKIYLGVAAAGLSSRAFYIGGEKRILSAPFSLYSLPNSKGFCWLEKHSVHCVWCSFSHRAKTPREEYTFNCSGLHNLSLYERGAVY